jgi:hexosaminidase
VIPEINFPGHSRAAIYAMENRYERLMAEGQQEEAEAFRLLDPEDQSVYNSAQNFNDNIVCVCQEAPFRFYERVVDEVAAMYREAGLELTMLHTGGDEVPAGSWTGSPICREFLNAHPEVGGPAGLQAWFGAQLMEMLAGKGILMAGWEEAALLKDERGRWIPNEELNGGQVVPYVWNSLGSYLDLGNRVANAGFPVVLCNVDNFYFDLAYSHHPSEPGLYWGGHVDTRRAFCFSPYHVARTTLTDRYRRPLDASYFTGMEQMMPEARKNILGLQGQLWSETFRDSRMLEYYYLPKMLGLAERAWAGEPDWASIPEMEERVKAMNRDWSTVAGMIARRVLPRLDHLNGGYFYRIPPPGAVIRDGYLHANVAFPGMEIRYSSDGSEPDRQSPLYEGPVQVSGPVKLRTFSAAGRGSRVSVAEVPD